MSLGTNAAKHILAELKAHHVHSAQQSQAMSTARDSPPQKMELLSVLEHTTVQSLTDLARSMGVPGAQSMLEGRTQEAQPQECSQQSSSSGGALQLAQIDASIDCCLREQSKPKRHSALAPLL